MASNPDLASDPRQRGKRTFRPAGAARTIGLTLAAAIGCVGLAIAAGFVVFVRSLERQEPSAPPHADAIVALTGGAERIADAVDLLRRGRAARLLITGVNERTSREELAGGRPELRKLFSCCVDLDYRAQNTVGNARQTRDWAKERGFRSMLVVTSNYHMPRSLAEISHAAPQMTLIPYPVAPDALDLAHWWRDPGTAKLLAVEYVKYLATLTRIHAGVGAEPAVAPSGRSPTSMALRQP